MAVASTGTFLVCPESGLALRACAIEEAKDEMGTTELIPRGSDGAPSVGPTPIVMLREDRGCAYPIVAGIPVLLVPQQLRGKDDVAAIGGVDISDPRYAESYDEMLHYNAVAQREAAAIHASPAAISLSRVLELSPTQRLSFPEPHRAWVDATYEPVAQWEAFCHLAPLSGKTVLQVGGKGSHAARFLLAGAAEAWLISPMIEELEHGRALAEHIGREDGYRCVAGIAEEMPFADGTFDAIYSESCVHHMVTALAAAECHRILRPGGRFAAVEPWRAPLYQWGIKIFGKREKGVSCRPMTHDRANPFREAFDETSILHHGALTRYPLLAFAQMGLELRPHQVFKIVQFDDKVSSLIRPVRDMGSSTAILCTRTA